MTKSKNILFIGSGNSATLVNKLNLDEYTICCVNNAWRLFENSPDILEYWIHSGDFPKESYPEIKCFSNEISHKEYVTGSSAARAILGWKVDSPEFLIGYTIFFQGIYWIMMELKPEKISLLGFDHDYNPEKVEKWLQNDNPNPQNYYHKDHTLSIKHWASMFFENMESDCFYGWGTPDPIRFGEAYLLGKFALLEKSCETLGIQLVNLSPVESHLNPIRKEAIS